MNRAGVSTTGKPINLDPDPSADSYNSLEIR